MIVTTKKFIEQSDLDVRSNVTMDGVSLGDKVPYYDSLIRISGTTCSVLLYNKSTTPLGTSK